jgi:hypothetical protein
MSKEPLYPHIPKSKNKVTTNVSDERIQDLLTSAFEGGSNYWYIIKKYNYPPGQTRQSLGIKFPHIELPFKGGSLLIGDIEGDKEYDKILDRTAINKGLQLMAEKYPKHYADFIAEDDDAATGDVFLQLALFGEVVFG